MSNKQSMDYDDLGDRNDVIFRGAEPVVATESAECSAG